MQGLYNMRSPAVKRLMKEAQELHEPTEQYFTQPLEDNLFEWHFTLRGPLDSEFDGGLYHGRIILPPDYPMKPPSIIILTPNGRFETNKKICLSISGHHPESWQPSWSIRTAMLAIIGFMPTHGGGALGSLDYTPDERKRLAKRSRDWQCPQCGRIDGVLKPVTAASEQTRQEARQLAAQMDFKNERERQEAVKAVESLPGEATPTSASPAVPDGAGEATPTSASPTVPDSASPPTVLPPPLALPLPFAQFPFLPPFLNAGQQPRPTPGTSVPRFPLPFVSPMLPMPPYMMHNARFPMPGFGPRMVPPWLPGATGMGTRPPVVPPNVGEPEAPRESTPPISTAVTTANTDANTASTAADTASTAANTASTASTAATTASTPVTTTSGPAMDTVTGSIHDNSSTPTPGTSRAPETPSTSTNTDTNSGVRQRNVTTNRDANAPTTPAVARVNQHAEIPPERPSLPSVGYLVFVGTILTIIALLIFRRLHMMKYFTLRF